MTFGWFGVKWRRCGLAAVPGERYMQQRKEQTSRRGLTQGVRPGCEFVLRVRCALLGARRAVNYFFL